MIECLLIGGRAHGMKVNYGGAASITMPGLGSGLLHYQCENYLTQGRLYRIARCNPTFDQIAEIGNLVREKKLAHIAGD